MSILGKQEKLKQEESGIFRYAVWVSIKRSKVQYPEGGPSIRQDITNIYTKKTVITTQDNIV